MAFKLNKNDRYIIATDLDGTFLHPFNHTLHIKSFEAVEKIKEAGHHFVITTGRSWWWTKTLYDQLNSVDASIHFSGAFVHHPHDENFSTFKQGISQQVIRDLNSQINLWDYLVCVQAVGRKHHATWTKGDDLSNIFFNSYEYIMILDESKIEIPEFVKLVEGVIGEGFFTRVWRGMTPGTDEVAIVISPQGTNKSEGLKKIAEYYGIPRENVIYFGDNVNDLDALDWAGHSYAPSSATDIAKEHADEILELGCQDGAVPRKMIELIDEANEDN